MNDAMHDHLNEGLRGIKLTCAKEMDGHNALQSGGGIRRREQRLIGRQRCREFLFGWGTFSGNMACHVET